MRCVCCHRDGDFSIKVAKPLTEARTLWFCEPCMRTVENSFRATVLYLRTEHEQIAQRD